MNEPNSVRVISISTELREAHRDLQCVRQHVRSERLDAWRWRLAEGAALEAFARRLKLLTGPTALPVLHPAETPLGFPPRSRGSAGVSLSAGSGIGGR
jgi:hypothetical protein